MRGKRLKRWMASLLAVTVLFSLCSVTGFAQENAEPSMTAGETVEAEACVIISDHGKDVEDDRASGGHAVELVNGQPGGNRYVPTDDTWTGLSVTFQVEAAGTYALSFRYLSSSNGNDSFYYSFASESFVEGATTVCEDGAYRWQTLGTAYLEPGTYQARIAVRESGLRIDQIKVGDSWVEPAVSGQTVYPELIQADAIGTAAKFEDGDRVAFIGDSITHGGYTHAYIYNYYATRYPNCDFTYINKGINGDRASSAQSRFEHDIYDANSNFNKVVIMLGTNDMSRGEYFVGKELESGAETRRNNLIETYKREYRALLELVKAKSPEQVILVTPPMFDEWVPESNNETSPGFNNVIRKAGAIVYDFAQEYGYDFVDVNTPQTIVDAYQRQSNEDFTFTPDRVHPSNIGHYIMMYSFLKAQGESGEVASVSVDTAQQSANTSNAAVSDLAVSDDKITFTYLPNSLPMGADAVYREAEKLIPLTEELNRETITVSGLRDGLYQITMNGKPVMQATGAQLQGGVNIADQQNNPNQQQALTVLSYVNKHRDTMMEYRNFVANEISYISKYSLDAQSNETLISSAQAWIASNSGQTADVEILNNYLADKAEESNTLAKLAQYEETIQTMNDPVSCSVEIEHIGDGTAVQNSAVYEHVSLPQDTLAIIPETDNGKMTAAQIVFADEAGGLEAIPAVGETVTASATIENNTSRDGGAVFWVGMFAGNRMVGVKTVEVTVPAGESVPVEAQLTVPAGTNTIQAGIWDSLSGLRPYIPSAVFPAENAAVREIRIGQETLAGFDPAVTEYTYYLHRLDTRVPYVSAVMENSLHTAAVTQAAAVGESATVQAGDKTYTITFVSEPLPVLSGINIGGTALSGFAPETYEYTYEVPDGGDTTVEAWAAEGLQVDVTQAEEDGTTATVTVTAPFGSSRTYTITFGKVGTPGVVSNIYAGGQPTVDVTAVPSLGAQLIDMYNAYGTDAERIAAVKSADNPYAKVEYAQYTNRDSDTAWDVKTSADNWLPNTYGSAIEFTYAQTTDSALISPNVTRLYKSTDDPCSTEEIAKKAYEFDISKDATVVIATNGESEFIASQGWEYKNDAKYELRYPNYTRVQDTSVLPEEDWYIIPNGSTAYMGSFRGSVYLKHFKAGERVAVPAFSVGSSYRNTSIFIIWDECNREAQLFDIMADGVSIAGFDPDVMKYTIPVVGDQVPQISVSATIGAAAEVIQAQTLSESAIVTACGKTYIISFEGHEPSLELSTLTVDGQQISGFDPTVKEYTYTVERGDMTVPTVAATASDSTNTVEVVPAAKMPGDTKVIVRTPQGISETYTVHFNKTGTPGVVSNIYAGGQATTAVTAVPSLGAEMIDMYNAYETDAERIAAVKSPNNPYASYDYAQYTDRLSGEAWENKSGPNANPANTYGAANEFTYLNHPESILISPDVTRLYKSTTDPCGDEETAKRAYEFDISKDATVYITTPQESSFIAAQGWTFENDAKYRLYYSRRGDHNIVQDPSDSESFYMIPDGVGDTMGNGNGIVYKKHFSKEERVVVPAFSVESSYRNMNVFIVWDDCNDEREVFGLKYKIGDETFTVEGFDPANLTYDVTLPVGTSEVPELWMMATRPANAQVSMPEGFTDGKATATVTAELESGVKTTYTINFYLDVAAEDDVRLSEIRYDGTAIEGFEPYTRSYTVELPMGASYPTVTAVANSSIAPQPAIIQPAAGNNGTATITVTSQNGQNSAVYTVQFVILDYVPAQASVLPVRNNAKGIVTIMHDDGDLPTVEYLDGEFEENNLKGTVAMIASRVNDNNVAAWQSYFDTGRFNLANHSYTHSYWGQDDSAESGVLSDGTPYEIAAGNMTKEIITSGEYLREKFPEERVLSFVKPGFVYPTGLPQVSDAAYDMIRENYICMRNTGGGMNTIPPADWDNVKSLMVRADSDPASPNNHTAAYWIDEVDKTIEQHGWLVFLFHNIVEDAQVGTGLVSQSKASILFDALGDRVQSGDVWCAYLDEAAMYIKESQSASVYAKKYQGDSVGVVLTDGMEDSVYNFPITVKVEVPEGWDMVSVTQDGKVLEVAKAFTEGTSSYVYANIVPDAGEATLAPADVALYVEEIAAGGTPLAGFSPEKYAYTVTLPAGTAEAPQLTVQYGGTADIEQAVLADGKGSATVTISPEGSVPFTYTVFFEVEKDGGPVVILKFDDLRENTGVRSAMQNAIDYIEERDIKTSVGVIGVSLEDDGTKADYYDQIRSWSESGYVEIWNHGYYHGGDNGPEFNGGTYDEQYKQLTDTNQLLLDKCGVTAAAFGAPGNATDATTLEVLKNVPQIKITLFGQDAEGILNLTNSVAFEQSGTIDGTWKAWLDYQKFVESFEANKDKPYVLMQTHPLMWASDKADTQYKIFQDQIEYLIAQGVTFMTPSEYYASLQP